MDDFIVHADAVEAGERIGELWRRTRAVSPKKLGADVVELFSGHSRLRRRAHLVDCPRDELARPRAWTPDRNRTEWS